jgi:hypothetical protein
MVMVHHEVKGVVEAEGKASGRCSNGGDVALRTGSFWRNFGQWESGYTKTRAVRSLECRAY